LIAFGVDLAATVVIPARYGSTRFPAKILASATGKPLVQHVVDQARQCKRVRQVLVATDDQRIVDALMPYQTQCVMTDPSHPSGTDRIAEVAKGLGDDIIVNVQGDEPEIEPQIIDSLIERLETHDDDMATACTAFKAMDDVKNPNMVKVVCSPAGQAIYFSRSMIPFDRDGVIEAKSGASAWQLHLGIYAYRRAFLLQFASWQPTPLELAEKLEQLRALEHGRKIFVLPVARATSGIDTPQQYEEFVRRTGVRS
jgi:3-deoxy-manno-octulosonate cytidylyltransferase (CMP-KDO synthetase)